MTATNHVITGTLIGAVVVNPWLAVSAAFFSHFVLDSLIHYGKDDHISKEFQYLLFTDMAIALLILLTILVVRPIHWPILIVCGVLAASPDLMWLPHYLRELERAPKKSLTLIERWHGNIQWGERPWGVAVEMVWFVAMLTLLLGHFS